jgi:SPP1 family phage portal protein
LPHGFGAVPAVEFMQNRARKGVFESVLPLIDSYNKALSECANDVDYFADAYLRVLGAKVEKETIRFMRENRTINIPGSKGENVVVDFLQKPSSNQTQENLLNRIERMIFTIAMVCNISDENFATSSGIALKYKLEPMNNLASKKWRKFQTGLKDYYKLVCANPVTPVDAGDWSKLKFSHTLNYPANNLDEAQTAQTLQGIVSKKTQLKTLSCVNNVYDELEEIRREQEEQDDLNTIYATNRVVNNEESGSNTDAGVSGTAIDRADSPKAIKKSVRNRSR